MLPEALFKMIALPLATIGFLVAAQISGDLVLRTAVPVSVASMR
jgi:predicted permease